MRDPANLQVQGREAPCPGCGTSAWYGARAFSGRQVSYFLCKWCGLRWDLADGPEASTLAIPVFHRCDEHSVLLTWHQFEGESYRDKEWICDCGAKLRVMATLRPYPRFASDPGLVELPGS